MGTAKTNKIMKQTITKLIKPAPKSTRPQTAGTISMGYKAKTDRGKEYPVATDHFRVNEGAFKKDWDKTMGEKPNEIELFFLDDTHWVEQYEYRDKDGSRCAYGDGETFMVFASKKDAKGNEVGEYKEFRHWIDGAEGVKPEGAIDVISAVEKKWPEGRGWDKKLTMYVFIPKTKVIALWKITTGGEASSIEAIRDVLMTVMEMRGSIVQVPFKLSVAFAKSNKPGVVSKFPVLKLIPDLNISKLDMGDEFDPQRIGAGPATKQIEAAPKTEPVSKPESESGEPDKSSSEEVEDIEVEKD